VIDTPPLASIALAHAESLGFRMSSEPEVGALLAVLAAAVPTGGRILEIGTGTGYGTGWLVAGLGARADAELVTVDVEDVVADRTAYPAFVRFVLGDGLDALRAAGTFDLVFADAPAGKTEGIEFTVAALRPGGVLVVDDMTADVPERYLVARERVRETLLNDQRLVAAELAHGSGVIIATRRH
jgi:demethylmenaquinone methyltransferase/2-methoxy-6-polyprenyl-1,4-benzoquinol methylase